MEVNLQALVRWMLDDVSVCKKAKREFDIILGYDVIYTDKAGRLTTKELRDIVELDDWEDATFICITNPTRFTVRPEWISEWVDSIFYLNSIAREFEEAHRKFMLAIDYTKIPCEWRLNDE